MTPSLQDYALSTIRTELSDEFGNISSTEIDRKINHAINLLWAENPTWRWSLHPFSLNVEARFTGASLVATSGSASISWTGAPTGINLTRRVVSIQGDPHEYIVKAHTTSATTATLDRPVTNTAPASTSIYFDHNYIELPDDFARMLVLHSADSSAYRRIFYKHPWTLELHRAQNLALTAIQQAMFYTIVMDPIRDPATMQTNRQYLFLFPALTALSRLDGLYYTAPYDLSDTGQVPEIPRAYRRIIFYSAAELLATKLRDFDAAALYEKKARILIESAKNRNQFEEDDDTVIRGELQPNLDPPDRNYVLGP